MYSFLLKYFPKRIAIVLIIVWYLILILLVVIFYKEKGEVFKYLEM
jgi:hypothetical protein